MTGLFPAALVCNVHNVVKFSGGRGFGVGAARLELREDPTFARAALIYDPVPRQE